MSTISSSPEQVRGFTIGFNSIIVVGIVFVAGMFVGSMVKENQLLKSGTSGSTGNAAAVPVGNEPPQQQMNYDALPSVGNADHVLGNAKAKVILVEYSDFECPFCSRFHPTTKQILKEYGDKVALVYRHYPIPDLGHLNAQKAAEGSECVAKQKGSDGFWAYADAIFATPTVGGRFQLSPDAITAAATKTGVNLDQFKTCLDSGEMAAKVEEQKTAVGAVGSLGTPATFIVVDGKAVDYINGAQPFEQIKTKIDTYL